MFEYKALITISIVLFLNLWATKVLLSSDELNSFQKKAQGLIVWLLPLLGSIVVLVFMSESKKSLPKGGKQKHIDKRSNFNSDSES